MKHLETDLETDEATVARAKADDRWPHAGAGTDASADARSRSRADSNDDTRAYVPTAAYSDGTAHILRTGGAYAHEAGYDATDSFCVPARLCSGLQGQRRLLSRGVGGGWRLRWHRADRQRLRPDVSRQRRRRLRRRADAPPLGHLLRPERNTSIYRGNVYRWFEVLSGGLYPCF